MPKAKYIEMSILSVNVKIVSLPYYTKQGINYA